MTATAFSLPPQDGPLVAVCALCGGAGASTLAYLLAVAAARDLAAEGGADAGAVLACDAGGSTGGLAAYAGTRSPRSLAGVVDQVAAGEPPVDGLFARSPNGPRVIATCPEAPRPADDAAIERVLRDAGAAHALTVVDCGVLARDAERLALGLAGTIAWVLPATFSGVARARAVLDGIVLPQPAAEIVVARRDASGRTPPVRQLAELADERRATLVLMPHVPDLADAPVDEALLAAEVPLQALAARIQGAPA